MSDSVTPVSRPRSKKTRAARARQAEEVSALLETITQSALTNSQRADALMELTIAILQSQNGDPQLRSFTNYCYETMAGMEEEDKNECKAEMFSMLERYMLECSKTPVAGTRSYTSAARQCTSTRHQQHARSTKCSSTSPSQPQWQPPPHLWPTGRPLDQTKRAETWQLQDPNWLREN